MTFDPSWYPADHPLNPRNNRSSSRSSSSSTPFSTSSRSSSSSTPYGRDYLEELYERENAIDYRADGAPDRIPEGYNTPWTSFDPVGWKYVAEGSKDLYGFTRESDFKGRANTAARQYYARNGEWPSSSQLMEDPTYNRYLGVLASGVTNAPRMFQVDGTNYYNDPLNGPVAVAPWNINTTLGPGGIDAALESGQLDHRGNFTPKAVFTKEEFVSMIGSLSPIRTSGGGGGRGGGGRAARAFDREQLISAGNDRYAGLMFEDADEKKMGQWVDRYMDRANAFWMKEGGSLDFDTFLVNEIEKTSRYKELYKRKGDGVTPEEYMAKYRSTVEQFGFNQRTTQRYTESGLKSGAGMAGFSERLGRTREGRAAAGWVNGRNAESDNE